MCLFAAALGCDPHGACEPRILGNAPEAEQVQIVLDDVRDHARLPLCVDRISIVTVIPAPDDRDLAGRARRTVHGTRIELLTRESAASLRHTTLHELCHALSYQHDLAPSAPWPWLGEVARGTSREEAFAWWCDIGPEGAALLGQLALPPDETAAVRQLLDAVWVSEPGSILPATVRAGERFTVADAGTELRFAGVTPNGMLAFDPSDGGGVVVLDLQTGSSEAQRSSAFTLGRSEPAGNPFDTSKWRGSWFEHGAFRIGAGLIELPRVDDWVAPVDTDGGSRVEGFASTGAFAFAGDGAAPRVLRTDRAPDTRSHFALHPDGLLHEVAYERETGEATVWSWDLAQPAEER